MSFKLNQQNPFRRASILARRNKGKGTDVSKLPKDKYGKPVFNISQGFNGKYGGSGMSRQNQRACLKFLAKRVNNGSITPEEAGLLADDVVRGTADRKMIYGFKPT